MKRHISKVTPVGAGWGCCIQEKPRQWHQGKQGVKKKKMEHPAGSMIGLAPFTALLFHVALPL